MSKDKKKKCQHCEFMNEARKKFCDDCGRPIQNEPEFFYDNIFPIHSKKYMLINYKNTS